MNKAIVELLLWIVAGLALGYFVLGPIMTWYLR
jgi:hypothetical protein